jgi:Na+/H+ antiporter NhaC
MPMTGTWLTVLPPLFAIALAFALRQVLVALFAGLWLGAWLVQGGGFDGMWRGLLDTLAVHLRAALADDSHAAIIVFSLMIGGLVGIISRNGGMPGIVRHVTRFASTPRRGQLATAGLGCAIFVDDYANTLIVGNTMRPVTDSLRVSREKLAYLVDSTAAPVAALALITTWIGLQIGLIGDAVARIDGYDEPAYSVLLNSLLYSFYPWLALLFVFAVALSGRDFGPMRAAERTAAERGNAVASDQPEGGADVDLSGAGTNAEPAARARNAVIPIMVLVVVTFAGLWVTGRSEAGADASLRDVIGSADPYVALLWSSLLAVLTAIVLTVAQRLMSLANALEAWLTGVHAVLPAMLILLLAWALAAVCVELDTAGYLAATLGDAIHPGLLPTLVFAIAALTAFATGTSWGTMGMLMPLVLPLAWSMLAAHGLAGTEAGMPVLYAAVAAVLAGAVWGDHCSPLSDTTILSSMACGCDHLAHVRTQLPYALLVGAVAIVAGLLPVGFGWPWWACFGGAAVVLLAALRLLGRRVHEGAPLSVDVASPTGMPARNTHR